MYSSQLSYTPWRAVYRKFWSLLLHSDQDPGGSFCFSYGFALYMRPSSETEKGGFSYPTRVGFMAIMQVPVCFPHLEEKKRAIFLIYFRLYE